MVFVLRRVITLDMHVMTGDGTGNLPIGIKSQSIAIYTRFFTGTMAKLYSMTLLAQSVIVRLELSLG